MKLTIVIPVYNEKNTIEDLLAAVKNVSLPDKITEKEIIIVDDYSQDGTVDILKGMDQSGIKLVFHKKNCGKGAALRTGFSSASGDIILIQDADLEYNPNEYPGLLKPILDDKADVVFGSRFVSDKPHRVLYFWHMLANKILTLISNVFSDLNLTDMETCYKVFKSEVIKNIKIEENRFGFEPEITAKVGKLARESGIRIYEVGISYYGRTYEEGKKIGWKDAARALLCIFKYNNSRFARLVRYGIVGVIVALSQFVAAIILIGYLKLDTIYLQNIANIISIEISLLAAFVLHSFFTWMYKYNSAYEVLRKLFVFHLVSFTSFLVRIIIFYILSEAGIYYGLNILIGICVAIIMNFFGYDGIVFKNKMEKVVIKKMI